MLRRVTVLTAMATLFVVVAAEAQTQMSAGIKGGIGLASAGGDAEQLLEAQLSSKLGFSGGAYLGVDLHKYFRLQFEGQYVQKGTKTDVDGVDIKFKLDYVEFMVPLTLVIPTQSQISPRLYVGPAIGLEVGCKFTGDQGGASVSIDCADGGVDTKSTDFGVFFGGGLDFGIGAGAITLDALYNLGLTNVNDTAGTTDLTAKNRNIQFMAGFRFFFGT